MTDKATLLALADKLEKATEGSRELDRAIGAVTGYPPQPTHDGVDANLRWMAGLPRYTASTDDALTLRPDGWLLTGLSDGILDPKYRDVRSLTKWLTGMARVGAVVNGPEDVGEMVSSMGANPALSVAAAALRARAA